MPLDSVSRKLVLLVEDEPFIALDVEDHLRKAGARVITAGHLDAALYMTEHPDLSGAIVDLRLGADSAMPICRRLAQRNLPFVVHTGYAADAVQREWPSVPIIQKPATPEEITDILLRSLSAASNTAPSISLVSWAPPRASRTASRKRRMTTGHLEK
jgi:CheY-like chemotaxis protein